MRATTTCAGRSSSSPSRQPRRTSRATVPGLDAVGRHRGDGLVDLGVERPPDASRSARPRPRAGRDEQPVRGGHALVEVAGRWIRPPGRARACRARAAAARAPRAGPPAGRPPARAPPGGGSCRSRRGAGDSAPALRRSPRPRGRQRQAPERPRHDRWSCRSRLPIRRLGDHRAGDAADQRAHRTPRFDFRRRKEPQERCRISAAEMMRYYCW